MRPEPVVTLVSAGPIRTGACILGGGPAGLGVAWELARHGFGKVVLVDRNRVLGGLSRTECFAGHRFDIGPHRFFSKNREVMGIWREALGADFRPVKRLTRIYYKGRLFRYPLEIGDALANLGFRESVQAILSFLGSRGKVKGEPKTFEEWVVSRFGRKLFETFFQTYTEKVWGIPCSRIGAEWAAQRIKDLDLKTVLLAFLRKSRTAKTLVEEFDYPRLGAGQMYEAMGARVQAGGALLLRESVITRIRWDGVRIQSAEGTGPGGVPVVIEAETFFTSLPLTHFVELLDPPAPPEVRAAARELYYRDHITVNLAVRGGALFPDQWIYVHSPEVRMARLANFNNFSPAMPARPGLSALGVEFFVFRDDELWTRSDADLRTLAAEELRRMRLVEPGAIEDGWVVRETESYPTYYLGFQEPFERVRSFLAGICNASPVGRGGMYKYNNMDHSLFTGLLAARNFLRLPGSPFDVWAVNIDAEYHEGARRDP